MKKYFVLLALVLLFETTFGQGLILGLGKWIPDFLRPQRDPAATESIGYFNYPTVNQSSIRINWIGVCSHPYDWSRDGEGGIFNEDLDREMKVRNDYFVEINYFPITWMFPNRIVKSIPNTFKSSWGCIGASMISAQVKFGRKRMKYYMEAELVGVSTLNEYLDEKIDIKQGGKTIYNMASAGIDYGLTRHTYLRLSAGVMIRGLQFNMLYPFVGLTLVNEETLKPDVYRTKY